MPQDWVLLYRKITRSKGLARLFDRNPLAEALFYRVLAASDVFGRIEADMDVFRLEVCPFSRRNDSSIEKALEALIEEGMLHRYEVEGKQYLQITNYDQYQGDQAWTRIRAECPPPPDWVPPTSLVEFLNATAAKAADQKQPNRFIPSRYGLTSNGDGTYRAVTSRNEADPPHRDAPASEPPESLRTPPVPEAPPDSLRNPPEPFASPAGAAGSGEPPAKPKPKRKPPAERNPYQQHIENAWHACGFDGKPDGEGYGELVKLIQAKGAPLVEAWIAHVKLSSPALPEDAKRWQWFKDQFRTALNRPWEWDPSRGKAPKGGRFNADNPETRTGRIEWPT